MSTKIYVMCFLLTWSQASPASKAKYEQVNFKPRFDKNYNPLMLTVFEDTDAGFILADISRFAIDDENDPLKFQIDNLGQDICTIGENDGKLRLKIKPDREKKEQYRFHVLASDNFEGGINREAALEVKLRIKDENDNRPVFQNTPYHVEIPEDVVVGSTVITVHATDDDAGRNSNVRYSFEEGNDYDVFILDPNSGVIKVIKTLDFEKKQQYNLDVIAKDEGTPALTAKTRVVINVKDIDDNKPYFVIQSSEKYIKENLPQGTIVATVKAEDGDKSINSEITYAITGGDEYGLFHIDSKTGIVIVKDKLDREFYREFELKITAFEVNRPLSTADITFKIYLLDENDNKPKFPKEHYLFYLEDGYVNVGTIISNDIKAYDADSTDVNSVLTYGMSYGFAENEYFKIHDDTGMLVLKKDIQDRKQNAFNFLVYATERDTKEHFTATTNVTVIILEKAVPNQWTSSSDELINKTKFGMTFSLALLHIIVYNYFR